MRRVLLSCTVVAILSALAPSPAHAAPAGDSVAITGAPVITSLYTIFTLDARSTPNGENPTGQVRFDAFGGSLHLNGPVTCLSVTGDTAIIGFHDEPADATVTLRVVDDTPDTFDVISIERSPTDCSPGGPTQFEDFVQSGDIVVTEAPPLPTSKDQCKGGGWRAYGVFKNQGDCVSFVATRGRNQPNDP
jgi:hypothetical protein